MSTYCDISKAYSDVFEKDFPTSWGVELNTSNDCSTATLSATKKEASVETSIKVKHHCKNTGADCTTTLNSSGDAKLEVSFSEKLPKGLKVDLGFDFPKNRVGHFTTEFNNDNFNGKFLVHHDLGSHKTNGAACALFTHNEFSVGGSGHFDLGTGLTSASFGGRHKRENAISSIRLHHKENKLSVDGGVLYHLKNDKGDVAGSIKYDVDKKETLVQIAFSRTLDDASWKAKINSDALAAVSYTHNWSKTTKVTTAVEFNALDPSKAKAGVQIKYSD